MVSPGFVPNTPLLKIKKRKKRIQWAFVGLGGLFEIGIYFVRNQNLSDGSGASSF